MRSPSQSMPANSRLGRKTAKAQSPSTPSTFFKKSSGHSPILIGRATQAERTRSAENDIAAAPECSDDVAQRIVLICLSGGNAKLLCPATDQKSAFV